MRIKPSGFETKTGQLLLLNQVVSSGPDFLQTQQLLLISPNRLLPTYRQVVRCSPQGN